MKRNSKPIIQKQKLERQITNNYSVDPRERIEPVEKTMSIYLFKANVIIKRKKKEFEAARKNCTSSAC